MINFNTKAIGLCVGVALGLTSCQKNMYTIVDNKSIDNLQNNKKELLQGAKNWFIEKTSPRAASTSSNRKINVEGRILWDSVVFIDYHPKLATFMRFPIKDYHVNISFAKDMNPEGFRFLLLRKDASLEYIVDIAEFHPDKKYLLSKKENYSEEDISKLMDDKDFDGYFLVYSPSNYLRYGERRENGIVVSRLKLD